MSFITNNIVFIIMLVTGFIFSFIMSAIRTSGKGKKTSIECQNELLHLIAKYVVLASFCGIMQYLSGKATEIKILQFGIIFGVSIIAAKIHCFYHLDSLAKIQDNEIDRKALKDSFKDEERLGISSFFMFVWTFFTIIETMCAFIFGFYFLKKMIAVIAVSFIVFVSEMFFGVTYIDTINQINDKVRNAIKKDTI